jgi:hypothetical protein
MDNARISIINSKEVELQLCDLKIALYIRLIYDLITLF